MPKISVIIPIYNAENYLARCLNSACSQSFKDIEIICVNDASADDSIKILNNYAQKYPNLRLIDCKENGGESVARNIGLDNANGEYIGFIDHDDVIDLDFYEKLYNKAIETNADIIKGNVETIDCKGNIAKTEDLNQKIISTKNKWHWTYQWWSGLYKKSLIVDNSIRFLEGFCFGGDYLFLHYALEYCKKLEFVNDVYYHWIRRVDSEESPILSYKKIVSALMIFDRVLDNSNKMLSNSLIDKESYEILFGYCMSIPLDYIFRNDEKDSKLECLKYIKKFYEKCSDRDLCLKHIQGKYPTLLNFFEHHKWNELSEFMLSLPTLKDFAFKNLTTKLRLEKGKTK